MDSYEIKFICNGKEVSQQEIRDVESERYRVAFDVMYRAGCEAQRNGRALALEECDMLPLEDAREVLANLKESLGRQGVLKALAEELAAGEAQWRSIANASRAHENLQPVIVEVEARGIDIAQFMLVNQGLAKENSLATPSRIHPEHYYFNAGTGGQQTIVETFGMYGHPVHLHLIPAKDAFKPIEPDDDTLFSMCGITNFASDDTDSKIVGMHQFKRRDSGLGVKLGVFLPEAAPAEAVEGHTWHLVVEFNNALHKAARQHPNWLQRKAVGIALSRMAKREYSGA